MSHEHPTDITPLFTAEFWDERYGSVEAVWSGEPNARLVELVADLPPGTALDVGSGEGGDAIWLASRGWQVTGIDVSQVALDRAAVRAAEAGVGIADRLTWRQTDLLTWEPEPAQYDLVSAHFMQLPRVSRESVHRRLADAVRPGGTLLIVGHHPSDADTSVGRPDHPDLFFTAEQVASALAPQEWQVVVAAAPERQATDPDGQPVTIRDAVMQAVRRR